MLKVHYRPTASMEVEIEGSSTKEIFKHLAELDETFGESQCGHCKSKDILFKLRENKGNHFPEMKCRKCHYTLSFGQKKDGKTMYPRRRYHEKHPLVASKDVEKDDFIPDNGWEAPYKGRDSEEG